MTLGTAFLPSGANRIALGLAALLVASTAAQAATRDNFASKETPVVSSHSSELALNLLAAPGNGTPMVKTATMGSGSWVCSPAGFGQRSRCQEN